MDMNVVRVIESLVKLGNSIITNTKMNAMNRFLLLGMFSSTKNIIITGIRNIREYSVGGPSPMITDIDSNPIISQFLRSSLKNSSAAMIA